MQFISNVADLGMNLQAAIEAPRFSFGSGPEVGTFAIGCAISIEGRIPAQVLEELRRKGQTLQTATEYAGGGMGMGQAVLFDSRSQMKYGASDPRADGAAIPEVLPWR
jgi:gamma-glutamyltranspeptidase/glutathione hydrolase